MIYDTAIPLPYVYDGLVARTVRWYSATGVENLLIGVPTYDESIGGHCPWAENAASALRGLKHGLAQVDPAVRSKIGAAVYASGPPQPTR